MSLSGGISVLANQTILRASGLPPGQFGIFILGPEPAQLPLGDGYLCISPFAPGLLRLLPVQAADGSGDVMRALDIPSLPPDHAITPGSTMHFQFWYRDPHGPHQTGMNLTDGLRVTFCI